MKTSRWFSKPKPLVHFLVASSLVLLPVGPIGISELLGAPSSAIASGGVAGTKTDKYFEACVSKCVFDETKPPPVGSPVDRLEAKDRKTVISDCRKSCAKTPEQLLLGSPKQSKKVDN